MQGDWRVTLGVLFQISVSEAELIAKQSASPKKHSFVLQKKQTADEYRRNAEKKDEFHYRTFHSLKS